MTSLKRLDDETLLRRLGNMRQVHAFQKLLLTDSSMTGANRRRVRRRERSTFQTVRRLADEARRRGLTVSH
jgi:hypothetical protein